MTAKKATRTVSPTGVSGSKLWVVLARAHGAMATFVEKRIDSEGLCLSDFMLLEVLLHKGPMTISAIGEKVLLANASMTSAVDRLEQRGYVVRQNSAADRRIRLVDLTKTGHALITELYARHEKDIETVTGVLTRREQSQMHTLLKKLGLAAKHAAPPTHR